MFKTYLERNFHIISNKIYYAKEIHKNVIRAPLALPQVLIGLSNFWKTLEMPLINCEIILILPWSTNYVTLEGDRDTTLTIADKKLYILL